MSRKQTLTILCILVAELGYALVGLGVMADVVDTSISYDWITTRLILIVIGMIATPIIISHVIEWVDTYLKEENQ